MSTFQPPPTWALPILVDEKTKRAAFNPVWLKWFVDLTALLTSGGGGSGILGNVVGPASATDNNLAVFNGTSGTIIKDGGAPYVLPTATASVLGGVKPDGTTITNTSGAISVTNASVYDAAAAADTVGSTLYLAANYGGF